MNKEQQLYTIEINVKENCIYKYYYEAIDNTTQKKDTELECRYFQYAETEKIQVDQWNKVWGLYRIRPKTDEIFQAYQIQVKNCQTGEYFELKKSVILFPAKDHYEILDNNISQKNRQFSLISRVDGKEDLSTQIQIQNINKFKMNSLYIEFDLQLFQKQKAEEIKQYLTIFETNQDWNQNGQIKILQQQKEEADKKVQELEQQNSRLKLNLKIYEQNLIEQQTQNQKLEDDHQKEIENLNSNFKLEKSKLSIVHGQEMSNLTIQFDQKIKYLSDQAEIQINQQKSIQQDFNQFQINASKKLTEYIQKYEELQSLNSIQELQLLQLKKNPINNIDNNDDKIIITLCDTNQAASNEEMAQMKSLKEKLQQYENTLLELNIKNQEIEQELQKKDRYQSSFKLKINNYIEKQDNCMQDLENTKKVLQDYINKNQILEQTSLQQIEHNQKLQKLLEIVKQKYKDLQIYKEQYKELLQKYEIQTELFRKLELQKQTDDKEFESFKEEKSQQLNQLAHDYQKSIKQYQDENQTLLKNQKEEQLQRLQLQYQLFIQCSQEILENIFTEILRPYQHHQERFSRKLSCTVMFLNSFNIIQMYIQVIYQNSISIIKFYHQYNVFDQQKQQQLKVLQFRQ